MGGGCSGGGAAPAAAALAAAAEGCVRARARAWARPRRAVPRPACGAAAPEGRAGRRARERARLPAAPGRGGAKGFVKGRSPSLFGLPNKNTLKGFYRL